MRTTRSLAALATASLVVLTSGCGIDPGHQAEQEFIDHFTQTYPDHVVDTLTAASDKLPWVGGEMAGTLVLADDTPPEVFATILDDLTTWAPDANSNYQPIGLVANGVGVCLDNEQQDQMQSLRDALYADGLALQGSWLCPAAIYGSHSVYKGTLADVTRDAEVVRQVWDGDGELRLEAEVNTPTGTIDHSWPELPDTLQATLDAVAAEQQIVTFELTDEGLRVAVTPTAELEATQEAATAAAGPGLPVTLMQGSLSPEKAAAMADLAHIPDALRAVEGVTSVTVDPNHMSVAVATRDPAAVRGIYDAAMEHPEFDEDLTLRIQVSLPDADAGNRFVRFPGGDDELLPLFLDLLSSEDVTRVWVTSPLPVFDPDSPQPGQPSVPGVRITLARPVVETVPELRDILPDGLRVNLTNGEDHRDSVDLTTAPTLTAEDIDSIFTIPDLEAIAAAWNAAG
ncbi:hypothetical protein MWU75_00840 [Ornithinimicrobium sp. F0845]|uniref:hypothetical protein n=1 Tax=Ornithinimicrobium sp. F0845 TaxID=2926412 RepID=UPI001FF5BDA1|nr:hypothetical protein [Ornithinimicrobium sp. F0845]MCK0110691.1 hypothetical protein [Ornithinimicrobium sp. F0845]